MPPHKPDGEVIAAEHRYEMVRRAVASNRFFEASRLEIDRQGYTYTVNTLMELKRRHGGEAVLFFIIGADVVNELTTWKEFHRVFELCEFIAVFRPGFDRTSYEAGIKQLVNDYGVIIHEADTRLVDISSRELRERCSRGESIKYLVPDAVNDYIIEKGLYRKSI
jgi:nicotinate-nucleotide adenylyltransferase